MVTLQTASDIQLITAVHSLIVKLETSPFITGVAIKLAGLTQQSLTYYKVPDSEKDVANILQELCEKDTEVKNAVLEELNILSNTLTVDNDFLENVLVTGINSHVYQPGN